ncbi:hypothetical protein GCM10011321_14490 [Youhaiella tibetensis]|uniref:Uncharacterized protein n=1 Tax=Paradevosia tibetensis TaxID=1447062 RepID=A0A5B9DP03_9HYPH|nr:glycosyl hydrolase 108 family protein [Youhaiella tibetensis]QEE20429.1 hypothetical protein FNA67_09700 [Youhaiella tibetensis]GGF24217.1 hypothetical protein GCM10011321_14490 [Youhaiella tibetensis]
MAKGNLPAVLAETLAYEGGWSDHPSDPGGATMKGITLAVFRRYRPGASKEQLRAISADDVERIYRDGYWGPVRGDDLPEGVDLTVFDYGVNSGPSRSAKDLQRVVGATVDGKIGPATIALVKASAPRAVIKAHCARRLGFVQSLAIWNTFGKGWARRIAGIEATSLSWVSTKAQLEADAKQARSTAAAQIGSAAGTGVVGTVDQTNHLSGLPIVLVVAAFVIVAGILAIRIVINNQRAGALANAAKEA